MKYRRLNSEELAPLNEEFLKYLLVANITPEQWEKLKENDQETCNKHLDIFSDLVFEKILTNIQFVDRILPRRIEFYQFQNEQVLLYALEAKDSQAADFKEDALDELDISQVNLIEGKKGYADDKLVEIFNVLQQPNAKISKGVLFKQIAIKVAEQKENSK